MKERIRIAANILKNAKHVVAFTGAGISVESGIPPFRGIDGLWSNHDPQVLDLSYFYANPLESWTVIKEIFYDFFGKAKPNDAHKGIAFLEEAGIVKETITQNIDNLHQEAGSKIIHEFHGNSQQLICTSCSATYPAFEINLNKLPPLCDSCHSLLKPDFIFFGEGIPQEAYEASVKAAQNADVFLVVGTTGEVTPSCHIPILAKEKGAKIIEINPEESKFTNSITDIYLQKKASIIMNQLINLINIK